MGDDLGVGSIKFSVTRAFQQDQIVLLGIKIDVRSYHSQGCIIIIQLYINWLIYC